MDKQQNRRVSGFESKLRFKFQDLSFKVSELSLLLSLSFHSIWWINHFWLLWWRWREHISSLSAVKQYKQSASTQHRHKAHHGLPEEPNILFRRKKHHHSTFPSQQKSHQSDLSVGCRFLSEMEEKHLHGALDIFLTPSCATYCR